MKSILLLSLFASIAYLSGSVPYGKIIGLRQGIDLQKRGSGNIGFANAWRVLGWRMALLVLIADSLKGFVPVVLCRDAGLGIHGQMIVGAASLLGHCYPLWLKFRGGKGIATGMGVTFALEPPLALIGIGIYLLVFLFSRKSAAGSIAGTWALVPTALLFFNQFAFYYLMLALFATWTHRTNLRGFLKGTAGNE